MSPKHTFHCAPRTAVASPAGPRVIAGQYELLEPIGEGGMGVVWRARDRRLDIEVAVKLVHPDPSPQVMRRLIAEARAAAKVRHPSAVHVHGSGTTAEGEPYIVMELLVGESLEDRLDREGLIAEAEAVKIIIPVVAAAAAAHDIGVVHRDLKPSNIFLSRGKGDRLRPKILDFGIAKHLEGLSVDVTMPGAVLGTPAYMSPEQARGQTNVDGRSDVWGLCAVLYEMLCGCPPFDGDNYNAVLSALLVDEPPPLEGVDTELFAIVRRGLAKDREARWPNARAMGEALARWLLRRGHEHDVTSAALRQSSLFPGGAPGPSLRARPTTNDGVAYSPQLPVMPALGSATATPPKGSRGAILGAAAGVLLLAAGLAGLRGAERAATHLAAEAATRSAAVITEAVASAALEPSATPTAEPTATPSAETSATAKTTPPVRRRRAVKKAEPEQPAAPPPPQKKGPGRHHMPLPSKLKI